LLAAESGVVAVASGLRRTCSQLWEAAEYLGFKANGNGRVNDRFVRRLIHERRIPVHHIGKYERILRSDLDKFIEAGRVESEE
jgi:excisionase family DNA binding protein